MEDVTIDENGYVMATWPTNVDHGVATIGFLAHLDTATEYTSRGKFHGKYEYISVENMEKHQRPLLRFVNYLRKSKFSWVRSIIQKFNMTFLKINVLLLFNF